MDPDGPTLDISLQLPKCSQVPGSGCRQARAAHILAAKLGPVPLRLAPGFLWQGFQVMKSKLFILTPTWT